MVPFAMLCFALIHPYAMLVVPPCLPHERTIELSLSQSICFPHLLFYFSYLPLDSPPAPPAFFHVSLYLIRFIASTILEPSARRPRTHSHLDIYLVMYDQCQPTLFDIYTSMYVARAFPPSHQHEHDPLCT